MNIEPAKKVVYAISELVTLEDGEVARMINPAHEMYLDSYAAAKYIEELTQDGYGRGLMFTKVRVI